MQNESEIFLPSRLQNLKQQRIHHAPLLSSRLFNVFEQTSIYGCFLFLIFSIAIVIGTLTTYDEYHKASVPILINIEVILFIYCLIEFILRIYGSESRLRYYGLKGKVRFIYEHYLIIDLILLISYGIIFLLYFIKFYDYSSIIFLHCLRFLQLIRFISLDRYIKSIPLISLIIWQHRRILLVAVYSCFLLLLPTSYFLWITERFIETDGKYFFQTYVDSVWFTINSMATIGYGETWPRTFIGRVLTASLCCIGLILWTLPAGIISASLTSIHEKRRKSQRLIRPAARLILAWWRLQHLKNQSRITFNKNYADEKCKQFIARLLYARLCREFRRCRYHTNDGYDVQVRIDIERILQCLHMIEEKLNHVDQKMKFLNQMLRVIYLSRAQPAARNLLLINKRYQQTSTTSSTKPPSSNPSSATKTTTTTTSSSSTPRPPPPPPPPSRPADVKTGGTLKAIVYGVGIGLGITLLYAEYDNGSFRRKVESKLPLSSTILSILDKAIDPIFGRQKKLTTIISEKLPDISPVTDRLPDKEQVKKAAEQAKDVINDTYDKLPEYKTVKGRITHAADQVKDAAHAVRDALPDPKAVKKTLTHAKDQVEDTAKSIAHTVKDALPATKGVSGEQSSRGNDPVFLEESGEVATPPPIKR
ncbi:unnamed protein product, partial [Rotaria sp. Silwood1]